MDHQRYSAAGKQRSNAAKVLDQRLRAWLPDVEVPLCSGRLMKRLNTPIGPAAGNAARPTSFDREELKELAAIFREDGVSQERCYGARR
ncbi:hypothetical protein CORC01_11691 [Colletotrichum orchidophilum]|uniref:Uncharacterized protein n=1 Tax=Colletotrichum orchidophilum TaxID=1209926 RepID=A0A1G4AVH3_9PEZI|nr:uncharacterized protein CORC01_11691 [Colletotrichum orchidophilum]OHE93052.1 hypothetical protein CORC01_11691 [Colletotrichum orchidophilum]